MAKLKDTTITGGLDVSGEVTIPSPFASNNPATKKYVDDIIFNLPTTLTISPSNLSGTIPEASLVDASIPVVGIVQTLIKNINGKPLTNYTDVSHMGEAYPYTLITYQSTNAITEEQAKTYMKSILGVTWLPQYNDDWPKNIYIIDGSGILWKPQWTNINNFLGIYELRMYYVTKITTNLTLSSGTDKGTLKLFSNGDTTDNIAVKGLKSAAYTDSTAYSASNHAHGSITNDGKIGIASDQVLITTSGGEITTRTRNGIDTRTIYPAAPHTHDDRYYTETEMDTLLSGKAASSHNHTWTQVPGVSGISVIGKSTAGGGSVSDLSMLTLQSMLSLGSAAYTASTAYKASSYVPAWSEITNKPSFATVATSGSYNDLSSKPTIPSIPSVMTTTEGNTGTATTQRTINAVNLKTIILNHSPAGSRPASDVSSWAKASTKPTYNAGEVGARSSTWVPSASDITGLDATHRWLTDNYITTWNNKEPAITKGTTSQYFRGDMSLANFPTTMTPAPHTHSEYVPTTLTISGKQLSGNIALYTEDIGDEDRHQYLNDTLGDLETSKLSNSDIVRSKNTLTVTSPGAGYSNNGLLVDLAANSTYKISMVGHWERQSPSTTAWAYRLSIISSATGVYMRGRWTWYQLDTSTGASTTIAYSDSMSASPGVTGQTVTTPTATTAVSNAPMCFEGYVVTGASSTTIRFSHGTSVSVYPPTRSAFRGVLTATKM